MNPVPEPALYLCDVAHVRLKPRMHRFRYRVASILLDIDRLAETARSLRLFSLERFNLFGFDQRDHGQRDGTPLRAFAEARLAEGGVATDGGPIRLLCFPRMLGYVFNPLSVYFSYTKAGALNGLVFQVHNTFGEQHAYAGPAYAGPDGAIALDTQKDFHVSPFFAREGRYRFRVRAPGDNVFLGIMHANADGPQLLATQAGTRRPLSDAMLARAALALPLSSLKVTAAIHWEALRLIAKGARWRARPLHTAPQATPALPDTGRP